jgi:hypothetical protein
MSKVLCTEDMSDITRAALRKTVERVVKGNKEVFDRLAKE